MEKNDFDDIILEKSNKNEKIKKILLRVIALVILFLVVIIVMKLINGGDDSAQNEILPPEPLQTQDANNNGFENVPITQNDSSEDQFEALRKQLEGENTQPVPESNATDSVNFAMPSEEPATPTQSEQTEPEIQPAAQPKAEPSEPKKAQNAEPKKEQTKTTQEPKPKQVAKPKEPEKADTKELFKSVEAKPATKEGLTPGLYVQIFSVNNLDQKSKELAAVKKKGYEYKLYKTSVNGKEITKVLIGPFDKNSIGAELEKIRKELAKDAFSFTLK